MATNTKKKKRDEVVDDDGNVIPPPLVGSDVAQLIYLLEYGRKRGFKIGPTVQVGDVIAQVTDLRQVPDRDTDDAPMPSEFAELLAK